MKNCLSHLKIHALGRAVPVIITVLLLAASHSVVAGTTLFLDSFNGPKLSPLWVTNLPAAPIAMGDWQNETYLGAPDYEFEKLDGYSVLRMNTVMGRLQRAGWSLNTNFHTADFRYEVRFNTLVQSSTNSIDSFIELWVLDPTDHTRYDLVTLFGASFATDPRFQAASSISGTPDNVSYNYQNHTFYRLVLHGGMGEDIRASLCDDQDNELVGYDLGHDLSAYPHGFTIGLSQAEDRPTAEYPTDVAVDYATVTTGGTTVASTVLPALQLYWQSKAGAYYQIQSATPPHAANWTNVGAPFPGTGGTLSEFLPAFNNGRVCFYQVIQLP